MLTARTHTTPTVRQRDARAVWAELASGASCSLVGASNSGKSTLLRALGDPSQRRELVAESAGDRLAVYIDLNMMVGLSENAFYELILRSIVDALSESGEEAAQLARDVTPLYQQVASQPPAFTAALRFNEGLIRLVERSPLPVALLLDEFDEPFARLDERVFLNMRALADRYQGGLAYAVATNRPLSELGRSRSVGEFCELFAFHTRRLGALRSEETAALLEEWGMGAGRRLGQGERDFLVEQAGGHVGLLLTAAQVYVSALVQDPSAATARLLGENDQVRTECAKLWNTLGGASQQALMEWSGDLPAGFGASVRQDLVHNDLLPEGDVCAPLPHLFRGFVERLALVRSGGLRGVRVDVERGIVWVDGKEAPELTDLEYRLLLMLYGRLDRICDKGELVQAVWGQSYIDEVDDSRIDKLVSRLRQKLEPKPDSPSYIITVRGRGFKLVSPQQAPVRNSSA